MADIREVIAANSVLLVLATAFSLAKAVLAGVDVRPLISKAMDEIVPALA